MTNESLHLHRLDNGMTLVAEDLPDVMSAAFVFLLPAGVIYDPPGHTGATSVLSDLIFRGAGPYDNRALNDALDDLGLHRHSAVATTHATFGGSLIHDKLLDALRLHAHILRRPTLADADVDVCRELNLQSLASIDDEPQHKVGLLTLEHFLPYPYGRPASGKPDEVRSLTADNLRQHYANQFTPHGTILAVAGRFDLDALRAAFQSLFADWTGPVVQPPPPADVCPQNFHQHFPGSQVHIGLAYPAARFDHPDYYAALAASAILSGGMGSRLFTEVREKRGLCYAVHASYRAYGPYGAIRCYLGSSPDRAQQALDVTLQQLRSLAQGIDSAELDRATVGLRASLIMQGESSGSRAGACASDLAYLGRVRPLAEIENAILALTVENVVAYAHKFPADKITVASLGPQQLMIA